MMALIYLSIGLLQAVYQLCSAAAIDIRLVGGSSQYSGRVEILFDNKWGTVCGDSFSDTDAVVVCRMLNFPSAGARVIANHASYPTPPAQIWIDDVRCTGSEQSIADCSHRMPWGSHNCNHDDDVGVVCSSTAAINIRLVGGSSQYSGRVEILINEKWGTVCGQSFSDKNAVVVCRMLNFPSAGARVIANHTSYPTPPAQIWLDDVRCAGSEQSIADCSHRMPWGSHNCNHDDDVGVVCSSTAAINIRLVGGSSQYSGRVEILINEKWGTVCGRSFSDKNAVVVCRMLNFPSAGARVIANHTSYPTPPAQIWLDAVRCSGSEQSIADCSHRMPWGSHNCNHDDDVVVVCSSTAAINIRLVGGTSQYSGRVEILINEKWGTVCGQSFSDKNAVVVCRMLKFPSAGARVIANHTSYPTPPAQIWLDAVRCAGSEQSIADCSHGMPWGSHNCNHDDDVGVVCSSTAAINIRLVGGTSQYSGRVEILINEKWGTVCGQSFSDKNAVVVCRMLNFPSAGARVIANHTSYPTPPAQIWLDAVRCSGSEQSIADCSHRMPWGSHNCNHDDDVVVVCSSTAAINIRLVGGTSQYSGRVEILINEKWGTVCGQSFSDKNAVVVCRMLKFPSAGARVIANHTSYPTPPAQIWLDAVRCAGSEQSIADCSHRMPWGSHNCNHDDDVGVVCSSTAAINIRLVGGTSQYSGRVEILINEKWGTVCGQIFSDKNAVVVCRMLKFPSAGARVIANHTSYPTPPAQIWLDAVRCAGSEQSIADCSHRMPWGSHNCNHDDDVGVVCSSTAAINIRLVGGTSQYSGRVEILINGKWGTVCGQFFSDKNAVVVCRMLKFPSAGARVIANHTSYPTPPAQIWLDAVRCAGSEQSIADCSHRMPWGSHNCNHDDDVGVVCSSTAAINIRLVGGTSQYSGRVEILINEKWGTVCGQSFSDKNAVVVCRMLKLQSAGARAYTNLASYPNAPAQIWLDDVRCTGSEQSIADCSHRMPWGSHNCNHDDDVGVICSSSRPIRLVPFDGVAYEGQFQFLDGNEWLSITNRTSKVTAKTICELLGFGYVGSYFGQENLLPGAEYFSIDCNGSETDISQCKWTRENNDEEYGTLGLSCSDYEITDVRLDGVSGDTGLMEVFVNNNWRTVCEVGFTNYTADLICRDLGFSKAKWYKHNLESNQVNNENNIGSLICNQGDILLRDCEIIPMAYYSYGPGEFDECVGNRVTIACSKVPADEPIINEGVDIYLVVIPTAISCFIVLCLLVGGLVYCKRTGTLCFPHRQQNANNSSDRPNLQNETQYGRYSAVPVSITKDDCKDTDEANATIDRNNALEIPMQTFHDQHQDKKGNGEERNDSDIRIVANHNHDGAEGSE
ncbi:deleted in malignant brain tumors 1 protein-like isoform X1 [Mya arenaria]|uniref:deleted in malignant brain tumors 1 protein-like isoform X1 n=1 Tax=Mya arenaria TaxID=6604 RepID=UPI0022E38F0F|nr:deleted in malignant brain tumors 1 protein-like isoform X1 [Mya arenaria]